MELENEVFNRILKHLALKNPLAFKNKGLDQLKKSISVLHYDYLIGASKQLGIMLQKYPNKENEINNLFDFLMHFYNKRTQTHHMLFLWIHFFETALRSKMAVILAQKHSSNDIDDWFLSKKLSHEIEHLKKTHHLESLKGYNGFQILNLSTLNALKTIIKMYWSDFKPLFADYKTYNDHVLPAYGTWERFLKAFSLIRKARNDLFHNNPSKIKTSSLVKNIEILLLRLDFNPKNAFDNTLKLERAVFFKTIQESSWTH
ncbi:CAAX protease [Helicobacter pylori]|uniref:CAAX protease n=1 Tax=Helicobacter pylori TaxID=210 RepID=UPI001F0E8005|nr:CAAX protease [Helicobacter pylori]MCH4610153.1 CAAX protease [Helicobacter pylori]